MQAPAQKQTWKTQLADAVEVLYQNAITWGDAHHRNVIIEDKSKSAVLIDLADYRVNGTAESERELFRKARINDLHQCKSA